jgi:hypothetical protein
MARRKAIRKNNPHLSQITLNELFSQYLEEFGPPTVVLRDGGELGQAATVGELIAIVRMMQAMTRVMAKEVSKPRSRRRPKAERAKFAADRYLAGCKPKDIFREILKKLRADEVNWPMPENARNVYKEIIRELKRRGISR